MRFAVQFPIVCGLLATWACSQTALVVPPEMTSVDGNTKFPLAGLDSPARQQILIHESHLTAALGRSITGFAVRRDASWTAPLAGGTAQLTVLVSVTSREPHAASATFADNLHPNPAARSLCFDGTVSIPASTDAAARPVSFDDPQDVVQIRFATAFGYVGGNLCIDILGQPIAGQASKFWAVDAQLDAARGEVASVGVPCDPSHFAARIATRALVPGSTCRFLGWADVGTAGAMLIGVPMPGVDLGTIGIGGPGCDLAVAPFGALPCTFDAMFATDAAGVTDVALQIPADPASFAFEFRVQFLSLAMPIETSNALDCKVADRAPTLRIATVFAPMRGASVPAEGVVYSNRAPVLRLGIE